VFFEKSSRQPNSLSLTRKNDHRPHNKRERVTPAVRILTLILIAPILRMQLLAYFIFSFPASIPVEVEERKLCRWIHKNSADRGIRVENTELLSDQHKGCRAPGEVAGKFLDGAGRYTVGGRSAKSGGSPCSIVGYRGAKPSSERVLALRQRFPSPTESGRNSGGGAEASSASRL
jgi:hypothetical protein